MSREQQLDLKVTSLAPACVCHFKPLCTRKDCKRIDYSHVNSQGFVSLPKSWNSCAYYIGE